ncbi:MAG: RHS repeat domain-containing protein [Dyella sp.]|uniref:RHS repeat domain-containing protein n=1 Tax=Dyella sp. TaxID=1869338 RepID=UPI003F7E379E
MKGLIYKFVMAIGLIMASVTASATVTYVYTDPQGTPLAEADASGAITATFDYKPYGSQALGSPKAGPGYTGHVNDPDTGFVYMQARYYDPVVGRFLSTDPIAPKAGNIYNVNPYAYASDNPIKNLDKDGKQSCESERCFGYRLAEGLGIHALQDDIKDIASKFSTHVNGRDDQAGFNVTGLVAGKVKLSASGTAAAGGGPHVQVGLLNSNSSAGIVTPALGTSASVDANVFTLSYKASNEPLSGALLTAGAEVHDLPGGRLTFSYEPPDKFSLSLDAGGGVGASAHLYSVEAENDFSAYEHFSGDN